jgi:hypothetical protein
MNQVITALAVAILVAGCGSSGSGPVSASGTSSTPGQASGTELDRVYAQAEKSLRAGGTYHASIRDDRQAGEYSYTATAQLWVDAAADRARQETTYTMARGLTGGSATDVLILADGARWIDGHATSPVKCHGASAATGIVLGCLDTETDATSHVEHGRYLSHPALILVSEGTSGGSEQTIRSTTRLYLDPSTALPLGATEDGTIESERVNPLHRTTSYQSEFVSPSTPPAGVYDPASLGWHLPDPIADVPTDAPIYWLGVIYIPGGGLPSLRLGNVAKEPGGPGYSAILEYMRTDDPYGPRAFILIEWTRASWDHAHVVMGIPRCPEPSHISLPGGEATLWCPPKPDGMSAIITFADAVVEAQAIAVTTAHGDRPSPYDNRESMTKLIRALTLRKA